MPISCPDGSKPRYRVKRFKGGKAVRLAYCGNTVVEATPLKKNKKGVLKKIAGKKKSFKR